MQVKYWVQAPLRKQPLAQEDSAKEIFRLFSWNQRLSKPTTSSSILENPRTAAEFWNQRLYADDTGIMRYFDQKTAVVCWKILTIFNFDTLFSIFHQEVMLNQNSWTPYWLPIFCNRVFAWLEQFRHMCFAKKITVWRAEEWAAGFYSRLRRCCL